MSRSLCKNWYWMKVINSNNSKIMTYKEIFGILSIILTFVGFSSYIYSCIFRNVIPHPITWTIWTVITLVTFFVQLYHDAGAGAWSTGLSGFIAISVMIYGYICYIRNKSVKVDSYDFSCLIIAILSGSLWYFTSNALYTIILFTLIDVASYVPTIRKVCKNFKSEDIKIFIIMIVRNICAILALTSYEFVNWFLAAATSFCNLIVIFCYIHCSVKSRSV